MRVSDLYGTETAKVDYNGHTITVTYRPEATTPRLQSAFDHVQRAARELEGTTDKTKMAEIMAPMVPLLVDATVTLVASWDLETDSGTMWPVTDDSVADLGIPLLMAIVGAIFAQEQEPLSEGEESPSAAG